MQITSLTELANQFGSDKGDVHFCAHNYARVYESLLSAVRNQPLRLLEIGLVHARMTELALGEQGTTVCPSLQMWRYYLPASRIFGFDIADFVSISEDRVTIFQGNQGDLTDLDQLINQSGGCFDLIIDDGSHASHHQQIALGFLFQHLNPGGIYCIEDLHFQPAELELDGVTRTRDLLRGLRYGACGARIAMQQASFVRFLTEIESIRFFDSHSPNWALSQREDAIAVIQKKGTNPLLGNPLATAPLPVKRGARIPEFDANFSTSLPDFFSGSAFFHGQRIYSVGYVGSPDPRNWGNPDHAIDTPTLTTASPSPYRLRDILDFRIKGNALPYQRQGWDFPSPGGTWTLAPVATLLLEPSETQVGEEELALEVAAQGLVAPSHPLTFAEILVNGHSLGEHSFGYQQLLTLRIPKSIWTQTNGSLSLEFRISNAASPKNLGLSDDSRELGLLLVSLRITPVSDL